MDTILDLEVINKIVMSRQYQISNQILDKKRKIQEIDRQISQQTYKQEILNTLFGEIPFSQSHLSSSSSSITSAHQLQKHHGNPLGFATHKSQVLDLESINSEDLSFEIEKIRVFQNESQQQENTFKKKKKFSQRQLKLLKPKKKSSNAVPTDLNLDGQGNLLYFQLENLGQNRIKFENFQNFFARNTKDQTFLKKQRSDEQRNFRLSEDQILAIANKKRGAFRVQASSQIKLNGLIQEEETKWFSNQTALLNSQQQKQIFRTQNLQSEKRLIREQLLKCRVAQSSDLYVHHLYKRHTEEDLNKTQNNMLIMNNIDLSRNDLGETMRRGNSRAKHYSHYIQKNVAFMKKTQSIIDQYRKGIRNGS